MNQKEKHGTILPDCIYNLKGLEMNPIYFLSVLLYISTCYSLSIYVLAVQIMSEKLNKKTAIIFCTVFYGIQIIANYIIMENSSNGNTFLLFWNIYLYSLHIAILIFLLLWTYRQKVIRTVASAALAHFIGFTIGALTEEVILTYLPLLENRRFYILIGSILPHTIMMICTLFIAFILKKLDFDRCFKALFVNRLRSIVTLCISLLLMHIHTILRMMFPVEKVSLVTASYSVVLIVLALLFLLFAARYHDNRERIKAQESIILQQQTHLALLEELQQELRSFRHDFTNLMTGMTLQAKSGDLKGIQDFMRNISSYFDERLGDEIKNLEAVNRIQIPALRSMVTTKAAQMKQDGIQTNIEVLYPVTAEGMLQQDLLRCLGILLDNAIESAKISKPPRVSLILLATEVELLIAVSNSYKEAPNLSQMHCNHYTTKGKGHGTGLMSLRKIIQKYPGCITGMNLKDEMFHYEIHIPL